MGQIDISICLVLVVLSLVFSLILDWNHFIFKRGYFDEFLAVLKYILSMAFMLGFIVFAFRLGVTFSRFVFGAFAITDGILTYVSHILFKKYLGTFYRRSSSSDKIAIITYKKYAEEIIKNMRNDGEWGSEIIGIILLDASGENEDVIENIPVFSGVGDLSAILGTLTMDIAFLYAPKLEESEKNDIINMLEIMGATCYLSLGSHMNSQKVGEFAGHTVIAYDNNFIDYRRRLIKRIFDIICAFLGMLAMVIMYPFIALAIKLDSPGPVLFKQLRIGKNGRRFYMYKFRSMYTDAEERKAELMEQNEVSGLMFKMEKDPRVTKVGAFLRKTSLDEFPQFINILKGDMSMIGTRPPTAEEFEQYNLHYRRRLSITPGLTGMWQVSGRSDIKDFDKVVELDLEYIDNWSLTLDMKIFIKTIGTVLKASGSR